MEKKTELTFKKNKKGQKVNGMLNFLRCLCIPIFWIFYPFRFYGRKKIDDGACVMIGNHYRVWDVVYAAALTWEGIHYIAKRAVVENKFFKFFTKRLRVIGVNRDGSDARAVMDSIKCLKAGDKICIFPEGTRNKTDAEMLPFHPGAAAFAIRTKTPIVCFMQYKKSKLFRMSHILVSEKFELSEFYDRKLTAEDYERAEKILFDKMISMRKEHEAELASK